MQLQRTALHKACESDRVEVAATLLKHGANVDKKDKVRLLCVHGQHGSLEPVSFRQQQLTRSFSLSGGAIKVASLYENYLAARTLYRHKDGLGSP